VRCVTYWKRTYRKVEGKTGRVLKGRKRRVKESLSQDDAAWRRRWIESLLWCSILSARVGKKATSCDSIYWEAVCCRRRFFFADFI
jgi:hypothetical protein